MTDNARNKTGSKLSEADREMRDLARAIAPFTGGVPPNENLILKGLMQLPRMMVRDVEQTVPSQDEAGAKILEGMKSANESIEDYAGRLALALEREDIALRTGQPPDQGLVEMVTDLGFLASPATAGRSGLGMLPRAKPNAWRSGPPPRPPGAGPNPPPPRSPMPMQDANVLNRPPAVPPANQIVGGPQGVQRVGGTPPAPGSQAGYVGGPGPQPAGPVQGPGVQPPIRRQPPGRSRVGSSQSSGSLKQSEKDAIKKRYYKKWEQQGNNDFTAADIGYRGKASPQEVNKYLDELRALGQATGHTGSADVIRALKTMRDKGAKFAVPTGGAAAGGAAELDDELTAILSGQRPVKK